MISLKTKKLRYYGLKFSKILEKNGFDLMISNFVSTLCQRGKKISNYYLKKKKIFDENDESFAFDTPIMSNNNFDPYTNEENNQCFDSENDNYVDTNFQYENMQQSDDVNFQIDPSISHQI